MHFDLVLITNSKISNKYLDKFNYIILDDSHYLINDYTINNDISFDYIITDNLKSLKNINILKDNNYIICNYFFQTSLDHLFFVGPENNSQKSLDQQIDTVLEFLINY